MKFSNLDNPFFIIILCVFAISINTIFSIYFFPILLLGILFMAFFICLKRRYYYSLLMVIFAIFFIELNNGFKAFSITLLATFIYVFIVPYVKRVLSFTALNPYIYITVFYIGLYFLWSFNNDINTQIYYTIFINIIIDFIIFGVFI